VIQQALPEIGATNIHAGLGQDSFCLIDNFFYQLTADDVQAGAHAYFPVILNLPA